MEGYKGLLPKAKTAYSTTDLTDKKKLHEIIEISERREKEISQCLDSVIAIKNQIRSPEALSKWLQRNIHYKSDRITSDYWQTPAETLKSKTGDCEDFAILIQSLLGEIAVESEIVFVGYKKGVDKTTHAICVFKEYGLYGYFSGPHIHQPFAFSIEEIINKKYPTWSAIAKANFPTRAKTIIARK